MTSTPPTVSFFFDPVCPWTWLTSRWLVDVSSRRELAVSWRAFSLALINADDEASDDEREALEQSARALRVIETLTAEDRHDEAGQLYTAIGERTFLGDAQLHGSVLESAAGSLGINDVAERAAKGNQKLVRSAFDEIGPLVGTDVGSPVLRFDDSGTAMSGPIVNPTPSDPDEADRIFDAVADLLGSPTFYELKRSRDSKPDFG